MGSLIVVVREEPVEDIIADARPLPGGDEMIIEDLTDEEGEPLLRGYCPLLDRRGHGRWYFAVELPAGRDGTRRRLQRGGFGTRAAAEQARAYWLGEDVDPGRSLVTVGQWLDVWLEVRQTIQPSTRRTYAQHIRDYIKC